MLKINFSLSASDWSEAPIKPSKKLEDYAAECFKKHRRFYIAISLRQVQSLKPIPLSRYYPTNDVHCTYVYSTGSFDEPFQFCVVLPYGRRHRSNLNAVKDIDRKRWVIPSDLFSLLHHLPPTFEWQRKIADYCFSTYGPEIPQWDEIVSKINSYARSYPSDKRSVSILFFRACADANPEQALINEHFTATLQGASAYCYFALTQNWKREAPIDWKLREEYEKGGRFLTQLYCLAAMNVTDNCERTKHYLDSYRHHASHRLDAKSILQTLYVQYRASKACLVTPRHATLLESARALLYYAVVLKRHSRHVDAARLRQRARIKAQAHLSANPNDADALELLAQILQTSSLNQDKALSRHYSNRVRQIHEANAASPAQSPRGDCESSSLQVTYHESSSTRTPREWTLSDT